MNGSLQGNWPDRDAGRYGDIRPGVQPVVAMLRTLATPSNVSLAAALAFGWLALISWTGVGPDGWQARSCAALDLGRTACTAVRSPKDQNRLAPHGEAVGFAR